MQLAFNNNNNNYYFLASFAFINTFYNFQVDSWYLPAQFAWQLFQFLAWKKELLLLYMQQLTLYAEICTILSTIILQWFYCISIAIVVN